MQRRPFFSRFAAVLVLGFVGCASPTIPLPPPDAPGWVNVDAMTGEWTVRGSCNKGALVTVFNEDTGLGWVVEDRAQVGQYEVKIRAKQCDIAWVAQQVGQEVSTVTTFVVQEKANGALADPSICK